jgi:hypothetical protein
MNLLQVGRFRQQSRLILAVAGDLPDQPHLAFVHGAHLTKLLLVCFHFSEHLLSLNLKLGLQDCQLFHFFLQV